jgi:hypothetical protein
MANSLKVTLVNGVVNVDDSHDTENHVARDMQHKEPQIIKWHLTGRAKEGRFISLNWLEVGGAKLPPPGIFGPFAEIPGTPWATMSDLHTGAGSAGAWVYQLTIKVDGNYYSTPPITVQTPNPNIKND